MDRCGTHCIVFRRTLVHAPSSVDPLVPIDTTSPGRTAIQTMDRRIISETPDATIIYYYEIPHTRYSEENCTVSS